MTLVLSKITAFFRKKSNRNRTVSLAITYIVLGGIGFVFIYPIIIMLLKSFFSPEALTDPTVKWLPTSLFFGNYGEAYNTLDFLKSFGTSLLISTLSALLQTFSAALVGFGLARFNFPLKKFWVVLIVATFIIPTQVTLVPRYVLFNEFGIIESLWTAFLPALFGQGLKSALFIMIFTQFFGSYPVALDEAAEIDGAGKIKVFYKMAIPMSIPAIVLTFLFSFIWYWNETSQFNLFFGSAISTLPMQLQRFTALYETLYGGAADGAVSAANQSIIYAGTTLSILPITVMYLCLQRQFIESIEKTGIVG